MKNILIFPPLCAEATGAPYLSIYNLSAVMKVSGIEVLPLDLNEIFMQKMLNKEIIDYTLNIVNKDQSLALENKTYYQEVLRAALNNLDFKDVKLKRNVGDILLKYSCKTPNKFEDFFEKGFRFPANIDELIQDVVLGIDLTSIQTIGFSCAFSDQLYFSLRISEILKNKKPDLNIIIGGPQISLLAPDQLKRLDHYEYIDVIFCGYGENAIIEFFKKPEKYRGIFRDTSFGSISLKGYPFTDFNEYLKVNPNPDKIPVLITKGCFWGKCEFCDFILMGDLDGLRFKARPPEEVLDEIIEIRKKFPHTNIDLVSDAIPPNWYKKLIDLALERGVFLGTGGYMINNKLLTDEFFEKLKRAGGLGLVFGTESTVNRLLKLMNKMATKKDIFNNLMLAKKHGIYLQVNIIMDYPTTTYKEALITYRDMNLLKDCIDVLACFKFHLSSNTNLYNSPEKTGIQIKETPYMRYNTGGLHLKEFECESGMTPEQKKDIYKKFEILQYEIRSKKNVKRLLDTIQLKPETKLSLNPCISLSESFFTNTLSGISIPLPKNLIKVLKSIEKETFEMIKTSIERKYSTQVFNQLIRYDLFVIAN